MSFCLWMLHLSSHPVILSTVVFALIDVLVQVQNVIQAQHRKHIVGINTGGIQ